MKLTASLSEVARQVHGCINCRGCQLGEWPLYDDIICPMLKKWRFYAYSGGGIMNIVRMWFYGRLGMSEHIRDVVSKCTTCGFCGDQDYCVRLQPPYYNVTDIITLVRKEVVKSGVQVYPIVKRFQDSIVEKGNPYGAACGRRFEWLSEPLPAKAPSLFFAGCVGAYRQKLFLQSHIAVMKSIGTSIAVQPDEWCCGEPLWRRGLWGELQRIAESNVKIVKASEAKNIITPCPGCLEVLKDEYPDWGYQMPVDILHTTEHYAGLIDKGKMKFSKHFKHKVTYHDPCHLGRIMGVYEAPRKILASIPGLELVEMRHNKVNSLCCGLAGGVKELYPDWSVEMAVERVNEALESGADILATECPSCLMNFADAVKQMKAEGKIKVMPVAEIIRETL